MWSFGGGGGEAKGCQEWAGPGDAPWSWAAERESTRNGALGGLENLKAQISPEKYQILLGSLQKGITETLQVYGLI